MRQTPTQLEQNATNNNTQEQDKNSIPRQNHKTN